MVQVGSGPSQNGFDSPHACPAAVPKNAGSDHPETVSPLQVRTRHTYPSDCARDGPAYGTLVLSAESTLPESQTPLPNDAASSATCTWYADCSSARTCHPSSGAARFATSR